MESTRASSSARAMSCTFWIEYWWRTAWLPSRRVTSEMYSFLLGSKVMAVLLSR
ncbi:hypothetical protein D3C78_1962060 [compost metagenome]